MPKLQIPDCCALCILRAGIILPWSKRFLMFPGMQPRYCAPREAQRVVFLSQRPTGGEKNSLRKSLALFLIIVNNRAHGH